MAAFLLVIVAVFMVAMVQFLRVPRLFALRPRGAARAVAEKRLGGLGATVQGVSRPYPLTTQTRNFVLEDEAIANGATLTIAEGIHPNRIIDLLNISGIIDDIVTPAVDPAGCFVNIFIDDPDTPKETVQCASFGGTPDQARPIEHHIVPQTTYRITVTNNSGINKHIQHITIPYRLT